MDNGVVETKKRRKNPDRLVVTPMALEKLRSWKEQVTKEVKGIKLSDSDIQNWCIEAQAEKLSSDQIQDIAAKFFDEVKFAEWALKEMKAAKSRGERLSLDVLLGAKTQRPKRKRKSKKVDFQEDIPESKNKVDG